MDELICRSLNGRALPVEEDDLLAWRRAAPANEAYYADLVRLLEITKETLLETAPAAAPDMGSLIRRSKGAVAAAPGAPRRRRRGWWWVAVPALAAAAAGLLLGVSAVVRPVPPAFSLQAGEFVTGAAETATAVLSDGTVVRLAPGSRLRIPGVPGSREVVLEGQAYFAVAEMREQPFRVRTRAGDATVLGTRFEVRVRNDDLRLVVLEGRVALGAGGQQVEVGAGEMSLIAEGTTAAPVKVDDVRPLVAWLERFIVFQATPLREAARELEEEYGVAVVVTDSALAEQTITGWYADRSFEEVLTIICGVLQTSCSIENGVATIAPR